jgi:hypothetical protein
MDRSITIGLQLPPGGKARARSGVRSGRLAHYTPEKRRTREGLIRSAVLDQLGDKPAVEQPVELSLRADFAVTASWSRHEQQPAIAGDKMRGRP